MKSLITLNMPTFKLLLSYIFDWLAIAIIAMIGALFDLPGPYHRPFSLIDLNIQYPLIKEFIPTWLLIVVAIVAPAIIILIFAIVTTACPTSGCLTTGSRLWKRVVCQLNAGWMGLALSCAIAFLFTQGLKNLVGKPRPNMLARCVPEVNEVEGFTVAKYGAKFSSQWILVNWGICSQTDMSLLDDGFRSFPSGHASLSFAGLLYLALFLCAKLAITIPLLDLRPQSSTTTTTCPDQKCIEDSILPTHTHQTKHHFLDIFRKVENGISCSANNICRPFGCAAVPPVVILALPLIPVAVAIYITSTRYFQFYHDGVDVMTGATIGMMSAWFGFRWSQFPCRRIPTQARALNTSSPIVKDYHPEPKPLEEEGEEIMTAV